MHSVPISLTQLGLCILEHPITHRLSLEEGLFPRLLLELFPQGHLVRTQCLVHSPPSESDRYFFILPPARFPRHEGFFSPGVILVGPIKYPLACLLPIVLP